MPAVWASGHRVHELAYRGSRCPLLHTLQHALQQIPQRRADPSRTGAGAAVDAEIGHQLVERGIQAGDASAGGGARTAGCGGRAVVEGFEQRFELAAHAAMAVTVTVATRRRYADRGALGIADRAGGCAAALPLR